MAIFPSFWSFVSSAELLRLRSCRGGGLWCIAPGILSPALEGQCGQGVTHLFTFLFFFSFAWIVTWRDNQSPLRIRHMKEAYHSRICWNLFFTSLIEVEILLLFCFIVDFEVRYPLAYGIRNKAISISSHCMLFCCHPTEVNIIVKRFALHPVIIQMCKTSLWHHLLQTHNRSLIGVSS